MMQSARGLRLLVVAGVLLLAQGPTAVAQTVAITHVGVVDVVAGRTIPDRTVVIEAGRIVRVGAGGALPSGARRIDGRGRFLMPGLWDMHVHVFGNVTRPGTDTHALSFRLFLANGVTGVRDMWTDLEDLRVLEGWRREAAAGRLLMPRIVPTSTPVDGAPPLWRTSTILRSPDAARRFVDSLVAGGARTIKMLEPAEDVYRAVMDEARKLGVDVVGHVPRTMQASDAARAGQRSVEHLFGVLDECTSNPTALDSLVPTPGQRNANRNRRQRLLIDSYSTAACDALARVLVEHETWQVPTNALITRRNLGFEAARMSDPHLRYAAAVDTAEWRAFHETERRGADSASVAIRRAIVEHRRRVIARLHHDGVPIMAGTDLGNPFIVAGFSLHDELAEFVAGGMTAAEALRTATIDPARFLHAADTLGTVAVGRRADLILLDADPLLDIGNASRIRAVVVDGRVLDRRALDALLATADRLAPDAGTPRER